MDDKLTNVDVKNPEIDVYKIFKYFNDHPIMLISMSIALLSIGVGKVLDNNYNK